jgi:hypothetical protein
MIEQPAGRLRYLLQTIPPLLYAADAHDFSLRSRPGKWSKKEILGHLIDSACNNHQRFVRIQFEEMPRIIYDQDNWNACSYYQQRDKDQLVAFWEVYNNQLLELITRIPAGLLTREGVSGNGERHTLAWYITDYVTHMEHHLRQLVEYV